MDLRDYLTIVRVRWVLITMCTLVMIAMAALFTWSATPQYASSAGLFVSTSGASDDAQANQGGQFSLQRVKSYAELLTGQRIATRVVDELKLDESPKDLAAQISATSKIDTVILTVTVTDPSPERAKMLVDAVSDEFVSYVAELETPPGKDEATIKATVVDPGTNRPRPVSPPQAQPRPRPGAGAARRRRPGVAAGDARHERPDHQAARGPHRRPVLGIDHVSTATAERTR